MSNAQFDTIGDTPPREEVEDVAAFVGALDKVIRSVKLYQGEGSLVDRLFNELEQRSSAPLDRGPLTLRVASFGLLYRDQPVSDDRRVGYLFRLFCDGVREITFLKGIDRRELRELVDVLGSDTRSGDEDLVTLLWKRNLPHVRYYAADTFAAGAHVSADGELQLAGRRGLRGLEGEEGTTEIALSPDDVRMLSGEGHLEWLADCTAPSHAEEHVAEVAARIRAAFKTPHDIARFLALAFKQESSNRPDAMILGLFDELAGMGDAEAVAGLLRAVLDHVRLNPDMADAYLRATVGRPEVGRLAELMNTQPEPLVPLVEGLVGRLGASLVALLNELRVGPAQEALHRHLQKEGVDLTSFYSRQLEDEGQDEERVIHAIQALGRLGSPEATAALSQALSRGSVEVRHAALSAMRGSYDPRARVGLARSLKDPDRDNRLLALEIMGSSGDSRVTWALLSAVQATEFAQKEEKEQASYYRSLASFHDDRTVDHFRQILSRKNLVRSKAMVSLQLLAVHALAEVGTKQARNTLEEFRSTFYHPPAVRSAIEDALQKGRRE